MKYFTVICVWCVVIGLCNNKILGITYAKDTTNGNMGLARGVVINLT